MDIPTEVTQAKMTLGGSQVTKYTTEEMALATIGLIILVPEK